MSEPESQQQAPSTRPPGPEVGVPPALYPALAIGAAYFLQQYVPLPRPTLAVYANTAWVVFVLGLGLIFWSLLSLRKFRTTAIPHQPSTCLVTTGPYRRSRNPVYLGFLLLMLASGLGAGNMWILLFLPIVMTLLTRGAIIPEEQYLLHRFTEDYENYKRSVRRWF